MNAHVLAVGEPAPEFELTDLHGHTARLSYYLGKPVVLTFLRGFM